MTFPFFGFSRSLKTRVTLFTLVIFLLGIWSLAWYAGRVLQSDMQRMLGEQQFEMVSMMANHAEQELTARLHHLESVAASMRADELADMPVMQTRLEQMAILQDEFNGGLYVTDAEGTATASIPLSLERKGVNYLYRNHIHAALKENRAAISDVVIGRRLNTPVIAMAAPVHDSKGKVIGSLVGVVNLGVANFLDKIVNCSYGHTGSYFLVSRPLRQIVTATDKRHIMQFLPAVGVNAQLDRNVQGFEGSAIFVDLQGRETLSSVKQLPLMQWYLAATLPTEEAFAPIREMRQRLLMASGLLTLLLGGVMWLMVRRQLLPMHQASHTLTALARGEAGVAPLVINRQDEIGELMSAFNQLLDTLKQREAALRDSEQRYRFLFDNNPFPMWIVAEQGWHFLEVNQRAVGNYGYSREEFRRMTLADIRPKEDIPLLNKVLNSTPGRRASGIYRHVKKDGTVIQVAIDSVPFEYHGIPARMVLVQDVSERQHAAALLSANEYRYRTLVECLTEAVVVHRAGKLIYVNPAAVTLFGARCKEDLLGKGVFELLHPDFHAIVLARIQKHTAERTVAPLLAEKYLKLDGTVIELEVQGTEIDYDGEPAIQAVLHDITERKQAEMELRIAATAFESQEAMLITDADLAIVRVNSAFERISGYSAEEVVGQNPRMLRSGRQSADFYAQMWQTIRNKGVWEGEIWNRRKNGEIYPEHLVITAVKNATGEVTHYVGAFDDITQRKLAEQKIHSLAFYDPLTQLPNRRLLQDRLHQALAACVRNRREGALLFIDLDYFKNLNDTLGHDMGDLLLQQVAARLVTCVREGDTVARLGGDEFVVMLEDLHGSANEAAAQTEAVGEKILAVFDMPFMLGEHEYRSSGSVGAVLFNSKVGSGEELMKQADIAMYHSKKSGRSTFRFFDPQMQQAISQRAALEVDMRQALAQQQFQLYYQRQVDSACCVTGAEALIRWLHPERGQVSPAQFIPLAEETGLILPIGAWVLETACAQLRAWQQHQATCNLTLAVNVSAKQFRQAEFVAQVQNVVSRHAIKPGLLKLELTESMLLDNVEEIIAKMQALQALGVQFSLDDFGTGYSSLQYLKRLPLYQLKIDQSFVRDIEVSNHDRSIVRTIIAMAQSMNLEVIAEGVETEVQREILQGKGCTRFQGYLFGKPMPIKQFEDFL